MKTYKVGNVKIDYDETKINLLHEHFGDVDTMLLVSKKNDAGEIFKLVWIELPCAESQGQ